MDISDWTNLRKYKEVEVMTENSAKWKCSGKLKALPEK